MTENKYTLNTDLDLAEATPTRLRKYGNVSMPSIPLPYNVSTAPIKEDKVIPVWMVKQDGRTFIIAELSANIPSSVIGEKRKRLREKGMVEKI